MCNKKIILLFLNRYLCCIFLEELSKKDGYFEHSKHMLKLMDKKIITILCSKGSLILTNVFHDFEGNSYVTRVTFMFATALVQLFA